MAAAKGRPASTNRLMWRFYWKKWLLSYVMALIGQLTSLVVRGHLVCAERRNVARRGVEECARVGCQPAAAPGDRRRRWECVSSTSRASFAANESLVRRHLTAVDRITQRCVISLAVWHFGVASCNSLR